jgi:UDP-N-acetylmuramate: L-alanyl-gamma-D-glutamyl-meso-diaminopimelate ligase
VAATVQAVKEMFPDKLITAVLELHTFSSLKREFMSHYAGSMDGVDRAVVYYSPEVVASKKLEAFPPAEVVSGFARTDLKVVTQKAELHALLSALPKTGVLLLMSSGTFDGFDLQELH